MMKRLRMPGCKNKNSWEEEAMPREQRVVVRGRGVPLEDKFDLNDGGNTQLQSYNGGVRKSPVKVREGRREEKREETRLTRQREQGEEDKTLAKRENKRARKDEQGDERAKRRSSSTSSSGESESAEERIFFCNGKPLLRQTVSPTE